jgi:pre-mRNA-processing factor SLU7
MKETIFEKYGNAANEDELPRELLLGQSERQVEYDRAGRIIKGQVRHSFYICMSIFS